MLFSLELTLRIVLSLDAWLGCGYIPKESAATIWGAGVEICELNGFAYLLLLVWVSDMALNFQK